MNDIRHMHQLYRTLAFVLLSLLVHGAVLYTDSGSALSLSVANAVQPSISARLSVPKNVYNSSASPASIKHENSTANSNAQPRTDNLTRSKNSRNHIFILSRIRGQLNENFYYPAMARRHGWQGKVLLDFMLADNGHINDIRIKQSSGYMLLDRAAVDALSKVILTEVPRQELLVAMLSGRLSLPVVYRLVN